MTENKIPYKIYLEESEMPRTWYNVRADMKTKPAPLLNPGTGKPCTAEELGAVFCRRACKAGARRHHPRDPHSRRRYGTSTRCIAPARW